MNKKIILMITISIFLISFGLILNIYDKKNSIVTKNIIYKVKLDDKIMDIANKYNLFYREILIANNLDKTDIKVDTELKIPNQTIVKLKKDDTIDSLAKKFHISVSKLKLANDLKDNETDISNKKTFIIPNKKFHVVKKGETLDSISEKYNVTTYLLRKENNIKNINKGDFLTIPSLKDIYDVSIRTMSGESEEQDKYVTMKDQKVALDTFNMANDVYNDKSYKKYMCKNGMCYLTLGNLKEMGFSVKNKFNLCFDSDVVMIFFDDVPSDSNIFPFYIYDKCIE